jgi:hypothetical protein
VAQLLHEHGNVMRRERLMITRTARGNLWTLYGPYAIMRTRTAQRDMFKGMHTLVFDWGPTGPEEMGTVSVRMVEDTRRATVARRYDWW